MHQQTSANSPQAKSSVGYWLALVVAYFLFTQAIFISAWDFLWRQNGAILA